MVRNINVPFEDKEMEMLKAIKDEKESWHDFILDKVIGPKWRDRL